MYAVRGLGLVVLLPTVYSDISCIGPTYTGNKTFEITCTASNEYEYCIFLHQDKYCRHVRQRIGGRYLGRYKDSEKSCSPALEGRASFVEVNNTRYECKLQVENLSREDMGQWSMHMSDHSKLWHSMTFSVNTALNDILPKDGPNQAEPDVPVRRGNNSRCIKIMHE